MSKINIVDGDGIMFWCPGCKSGHMIRHGQGNGPRWTWNGSHDKPTFSPSVLARWTEPSDDPAEFDDESKDVKKICHTFITDGQIQFLSDCTHSLAGQTVEMPNWKHRYD